MEVVVVVVMSFRVDAAQHQLQASGWNRLTFCCVADSTSLQKSGSCSVVCQNLSIIYEENPESEPQSGDTRVRHSGCLPPVMVPLPHLPNLPPPAGCQTAEHYNVSNRTQRKEDFFFFLDSQTVPRLQLSPMHFLLLTTKGFYFFSTPSSPLSLQS